MKASDIYIDLGTANTLIYVRGKGFILNEPSVVALKKKSSQTETFATGTRAKAMIGKTPQSMAAVRPLKQGVIADANSTARMLHGFVSRAKQESNWFRPRLIISLPCQVTHFEMKSVEEIGYDLGASKVHLLHEPVAAAIGANLPVLANEGSMIVDIGGGTTEIAVLAMGGIITSQAVRIGGDTIDHAIVSILSSKYRIAIGEQTAEFLKINLGGAFTDNRSLEIGGLDLKTGLPKKFAIKSSMIFPAMDSVISQMISSIRKALEECPPEISADIIKNGIVLAGGGALIHGLAKRISTETGINAKVAMNPLLSVAMGGAKALENNKLFDALEQPAS